MSLPDVSFSRFNRAVKPKTASKICVMPWFNLGTETNGKCKICCVVMENRYITKPDGEAYLLQKDAVTEIFDSEYVRDVRKKLLDGEWPEDCSYCASQETAGQFSPRLEFTRDWMTPEISELIEESRINDGFVNEPPRSLEPRHGTKCNLRCNTCWSLSSSSIHIERKAALEGRYGAMPDFLRESWQRELEMANESDFDWSDEPAYLENFRACIPTLKRLYFTGGEPSLIKSIRTLLRELVARGRTDVFVSFTSNLTRLDDELLELASQFKQFEFTGSIDGYGAANEYIRYPTEWPVVEANLRRLIEKKISVTLMSTVQIANVGAIADLMRWFARDAQLSSLRILPNMLQNPEFLRVDVLPAALKTSELARIEAALNDSLIPEENRSRLRQVQEHLMRTHPNAGELIEQFKEYTRFQDKLHGLPLLDCFPHLAPLFEKAPAADKNPVCLAPWVHTYLHTSGDRQLCCVSAPADGDSGQSLEQFWNGDYMRGVRKQMLAGELPKACASCDNVPHPYYDHFETHYGAHRSALLAKTSPEGVITDAPLSFDYRISNLCNFKCQMCGSDYSSSWQSEYTSAGLAHLLPAWQREPEASALKRRQRDVNEPELMAAIEAKSIREIYWAGGEPLLFDLHWRAMNRIVELGFADQVYVRYNTNFSHLIYRGQHLFRDLLKHFPRFEISASLDATGDTGEYLRTGLKWPTWRANLDEALPSLDTHQRRLHIEHRLTVPGMFDLTNMLRLQRSTGLPIRTKLIEFIFEPHFVKPLTPLIFPRELLARWINETRNELSTYAPEESAAFTELLDHLATLPTLAESNPDDYENAIRGGYRETLRLEEKRGYAARGLTLEYFLRKKPYLWDWFSGVVERVIQSTDEPELRRASAASEQRRDFV